MKGWFALLLSVMLVFSMVGCGSTSEKEAEENIQTSATSTQEITTVGEEEEGTETSGVKTEKEQNKTLVVYYSWADNAILAEDVDSVASPSVILPGNVQQLAGWVQEETGGDIFSIRVTEPYPSDWDDCLE